MEVVCNYLVVVVARCESGVGMGVVCNFIRCCGAGVLYGACEGRTCSGWCGGLGSG